MVDGTYTPRHLKRHYFSDEMVDQLHLSDRVFQHILLKQLKPVGSRQLQRLLRRFVRRTELHYKATRF